MAVADAHDSRAVPPGAATPDSPTLQIPVRVELPAEETPPGSALPTRPACAGAAGAGAGAGAGAAGPDGGPRAVGRYLVEEEIGRGGMGVVYRAFDRDLRRRVAMKVLQGALGGDRDLVERFAEEAQATAQLQHPGIVPVYDVGVDGSDRLYFTMKLVRGRTLARIVERARAGDAAAAREFTLFRLLQVFADVARTIAYAHARGVVHRDLKPQNIMVGGFGEVLVMDWGLAKVLGRAGEPARAREEPTSDITMVAGARAETQAGALVGTPAYMAPEQARGDGARAIGPLVDVYALGATLYHVLTGRPPFDGSSSAEIVARVLTIDPPRPRVLDPTVPREVEAICRRAMEKAPGARYPSAQALADDVQAFLEGRPVAACPDGPIGRAAKWARRHRSVAATAAVALVLGLAGAVAALVVIDGQRRAAVAAREGEERARRAAEDRRREAEEARRAAEVSRTQAEDLLAFMLLDMRAKLGFIGRVDVLEPVASRAKAYYESRPGGVQSPGASRLYGVALTSLGNYAESLGNWTEALEHYRAAAGVFEDAASRPDAPLEVIDDLAMVKLGEGRALEARGANAEALAVKRSAVALLERLVARDPRPPFRERLGAAHGHVGSALQVAGRFEEALASQRAAVEIAEALVAEVPADGHRLGFLAACRGQLASALKALGRADEALAVYREGIAIFESPAAYEATGGAWQAELALMADGAAILLAERGELDQALATHALALDALERLVARDPGNAGFAFHLASTRSNRAGMLRAKGRLEEAEASLRGALEIVDRLVARDEANVGWRRLRGRVQRNLSLLLESKGGRAEALAAARESLADFDRIATQLPDDAALAAERQVVAARVRQLEAAPPPAPDGGPPR